MQTQNRETGTPTSTTEQGNSAVKNLSMSIGDMTCASCVARVERFVGRMDGVRSVNVNLATERADIDIEATSTVSAPVTE